MPGCRHQNLAVMIHKLRATTLCFQINEKSLITVSLAGAIVGLKPGLLYLKDIFSPPLDSFGCYCCNLKLVSSVKRSRLLCNWSWAGYWWLVSGRWQPIKTIDWGSSRVQPMGDNKSITNNDFPNQVICHQSPGGFTGSLLAANTGPGSNCATHVPNQGIFMF